MRLGHTLLYFLTNDLPFIWHEAYNSSCCQDTPLDIKRAFLIAACCDQHVVVTLGGRGARMSPVLASLGHLAGPSPWDSRCCRASGRVATVTAPCGKPSCSCCGRPFWSVPRRCLLPTQRRWCVSIVCRLTVLDGGVRTHTHPSFPTC